MAELFNYLQSPMFFQHPLGSIPSVRDFDSFKDHPDLTSNK